MQQFLLKMEIQDTLHNILKYNNIDYITKDDHDSEDFYLKVWNEKTFEEKIIQFEILLHGQAVARYKNSNGHDDVYFINRFTTEDGILKYIKYIINK